MKNIQKLIVLLYKIFFIGLLGQFFLHTFVTFQLGIDNAIVQYIWLWKEGVIGLLGVITFGVVVAKRNRYNHFKYKDLTIFLLVLITSIGLAGLTHFYFIGGEVGAFVMAFKYDFLGFIIFLIGAHSSLLLEKSDRKTLILRYGTVLKYCLLLALLRYLVIFIKPGTLKLFGYDNFVYEGLVGSAPPAAYYTHINWGLPRNQFLFERPITRGFFLTALWPLFYILFLHKKPLQETRLRWVFYALNIVVTFSRAAWGTRIIEVVLIGVLLTKDIKRTLRKLGVPLVVVFGLISILGFDMIMDRGYSNFGHITMVKNGRAMFAQSPLRGVGAATAGPGSHRGGVPFNPENQFLQIMIEFGIIGSIGRLIMFAWFSLIGVIPWINDESKKYKRTNLMLLAASVGMIGLGISGMVLHSFSDRMVVYPFMLLFGIIYTQYISKKHISLYPTKK